MFEVVRTFFHHFFQNARRSSAQVGALAWVMVGVRVTVTVWVRGKVTVGVRVMVGVGVGVRVRVGRRPFAI